MSVTFLIGNGFDLHMGMKTRYVDVYDGYIKSRSKTENISKFKELLKKDAPNEFTNWSDFEQKMGESTGEFSSEKDFVECVRDFKEYLAQHLKNEEELFLNRVNLKSASSEMEKSLRNFYSSLINKDKINIERIRRRSENYDYYFITFNYTSVLEKLLSSIDPNHLRPIYTYYLHGKLDLGIVLGADNEEQLNSNCNYTLTKRIERAFIKPYFNELFDPDKIEKIDQIISKSDIICVYGLSFGQSDLTWVEKIIDWLESDPNHHLVYFKHDNAEHNLWHKDLMMDIEDEFKDELLDRINYKNHDSINDLFDQVHIPVGFDIFNVHNAFENKEENNISKTVMAN